MSITIDPPRSGAARSALDRAAPYALVPARALLGSLFVISGAQKIAAYEGTAGYMAAFGIPGALLPAVIAFEIAAGLALVLGYGTRLAAFLLAGFSLLAGFVFHLDLADQIQTIMLLKNVAVAGGLLAIVAAGSGPLALDRRM